MDGLLAQMSAEVDARLDMAGSIHIQPLAEGLRAATEGEKPAGASGHLPRGWQGLVPLHLGYVRYLRFSVGVDGDGWVEAGCRVDACSSSDWSSIMMNDTTRPTDFEFDPREGTHQDLSFLAGDHCPHPPPPMARA